MRSLWIAAALLTGLNTHAQAQAQTVYRCGADGRTYSQAPCPGGAVLDVSDSRSADQRQAAQTVAIADRTLGERMERDRLQKESMPPARAISIGKPRATETKVSNQPSATKHNKAKKKRKAAHNEHGDFTAIAPVKKTSPR